jgi:hypothetical protein
LPYSGAVAGRVFVSFQKMAAYRQEEHKPFPCFPAVNGLVDANRREMGKKITRYAHISKGRLQTREKESIHECSSGRLQKVMYGREAHGMYL